MQSHLFVRYCATPHKQNKRYRQISTKILQIFDSDSRRHKGWRKVGKSTQILWHLSWQLQNGCCHYNGTLNKTHRLTYANVLKETQKQPQVLIKETEFPFHWTKYWQNIGPKCLICNFTYASSYSLRSLAAKPRPV